MSLLKSLLVTIAVIAIVFIVISLFDVLLSVFHPRFYSNAAFIVIFGVGGIFAAVFSYTYGIDFAPVKNNTARWSVVVTIILTGSLFYFLLSKMEGGEYEAAFKAFGVTLALSSFLFAKGKVEI